MQVRAAVQQQSDELRAVVDRVVMSSAGSIDRGMVSMGRHCSDVGATFYVHSAPCIPVAGSA